MRRLGQWGRLGRTQGMQAQACTLPCWRVAAAVPRTCSKERAKAPGGAQPTALGWTVRQELLLPGMWPTRDVLRPLQRLPHRPVLMMLVVAP